MKSASLKGEGKRYWIFTLRNADLCIWDLGLRGIICVVGDELCSEGKSKLEHYIDQKFEYLTRK